MRKNKPHPYIYMYFKNVHTDTHRSLFFINFLWNIAFEYNGSMW